MPTFSVACPDCNKRLKLNLSHGQTEVECPVCGVRFDVEISSQSNELPLAEGEDEDYQEETRAPRKRSRKSSSRKRSRKGTFAGSPVWAWIIFCFVFGVVITGGVAAIMWNQQSRQNAKTGHDEAPTPQVASNTNPNLGNDGTRPPSRFGADVNGIVFPPEMLRPVPEKKTENGWPIYEVPSEGFALAMPSDWREVEMNPDKFEANFREMLKQNPQLRSMFGDGKQQSTSGVKFFGLEESSTKSGFTTYVNVVRQPCAPWTTLDSATTDLLKQLEAAPVVVKPFNHSRIKLEKGEGERFQYQVTMQTHAGQPVQISSTQLLVVTETNLYVLSLVVLAGKESQYNETFDKIAQSFRLMKPRVVD